MIEASRLKYTHNKNQIRTGRAFPEPTRVSLGVPLRCLQVACGRKHTLALMEGGYVMSWG